MIYQLTVSGKQELKNPVTGLSHLAKMILFLADGKTESSMIESTLKYPNGFEEAMNELLRNKLLEKSNGVDGKEGSEQNLKNQLIELIREHLPQQAEKVAVKIQAVPDEPEALKASLENCCKVIKLTIDQEKARIILQKGLDLLNNHH